MLFNKKCYKVLGRNVLHPQITCHPQNILECKVVHSYQTVSHVCILEAGFRKHNFPVKTPKICLVIVDVVFV